MCVYDICESAYAATHTWRSEDTFQGQLTPSTVGSKTGLRRQPCTGSALIRWAISLRFATKQNENKPR